MKEFDGILLNFTEDQIKRFWKKVNVKSSDECWEWLGVTNDLGYGYFGNPAKGAHRISYVLHYGKLPMNLSVCHICDNPPCVNPKHLFSGTHSDNMKDRNSKKRWNAPSGSNHWKAKLSELSVLEIRLAYKEKIFNQVELAELYDVSISNITAIINNKSWKNV